MEYLQIFKLLYEHNIRYLICGGLAVNIYGIPRMTVDIDLVLDLNSENIESFVEVLSKLGYKPQLPVNLVTLADKKIREDLKNDKNLIAYSFYNPSKDFMQLDVLIDVPLSFDELWATKETRQVSSFSVYLVSVEQLIKMKEYSNRVQDKNDILQLSKLIKK